MSSAVLKPEVAEFRLAGAGPSAEIRRYSAGMRAVTALRVTAADRTALRRTTP